MKNKIVRISLIGGGPASISFILQFYKQIKNNFHHGKIEILVFEKNSIIGPGLPYSKKEDCYILNLPKYVMEPEYGKAGVFNEWLKGFSHNYQTTDYPPRHFFGKYLTHLSESTQSEATNSNLIIKYFVKSEVVDIIEHADNNFCVCTKEINVKTDFIVLCTGHMPPTTDFQFQDVKEYKQDPWDKNAYNEIAQKDDVAIIGTRLTAIDIILMFKARNHCGKIYAFSRGGLIPAVLSKEISPYELKYLRQERINERLDKNGILLLSTLLELFWEEISMAVNKACNFNKIFNYHKRISPLCWLNKQIQMAETGPKIWQQVLFAIYPHVPCLWSKLSMEDKQIFLRDFYGIFINYLAAFPLENAYKIGELLQSGQLEISGGLKEIQHNDAHFMINISDKRNIKVKHLFNGTGPGYDPTAVNLYRKMIHHGIVKRHPLGGIHVDPNTLQILSKRGTITNNIYALGELTRGDYLATTDMTRVAAQAKVVATNMLLQITSRNYFTEASEKTWLMDKAESV